MEERINLIKEKLTGNLNEDIEYLTAMSNAQEKIINEATEKYNAINTILDELTNEIQENEVEESTEKIDNENNQEVIPYEEEIDKLLEDLNGSLNNDNIDEAYDRIRTLIAKIEEVSKTDEKNVIYCSFSSQLEKMIFEDIFADEKEVRYTPYANDVIYVLYADILLRKKKRQAAMEALDRAIYWNFLSRDARSKKIDLYYSRKELVKCLGAIKRLQMISYTSKDIAECYNKYAFIFENLKDPKSAYALYKLSYNYYEDEEVEKVIKKYLDEHPEFSEITDKEIIDLAIDNDVDIGPNTKIISACRNITGELVKYGRVEEAMIMLENDYSMTRDDKIASLYEELSNTLEEPETTNEVVEDKPKTTRKGKETI